MPYLQLDGQRITLEIGETTIGSAPEARVKVAGVEGTAAILRVGANLQSAIRRAGEAAVRVNGVQLGAEPTPLIHGDKIEVGQTELFFGDDRMAGSTQYISSANLQQAGIAAPPRPATRRTRASGGRLVSLVDGREYAVPAEGLVIGRDAACDVVVPTAEVSRRHAQIVPSQDGYVLKDTSTNGVFVNGERVAASQVLGRGDILRIGNEDFRFYADVGVDATPADVTPTPADPAAAAEAARAAAALRSTPPREQEPAPAAPSPTPAPARASGAGAPTPIIAPRSITTPAASQRPVLATLQVTSSGVLNGQQFEVRTPLTHVGRGAHNDIVLPDESVSDSHAKIQKREVGWYVVDMGSTNGTYVGGRRVDTEHKIEGAPDLRFGGVKIVFRTAEAGGAPGTAEDVKGTRAFSMPRSVRAPQPTKPTGPAVAPGAEDPDTEKKGPGFPVWLWLAVLVLIALGAFFIYEQIR